MIERRPAVGRRANYLLKAKLQRLIVCYCEKSILQSLSMWSKGTSWAHRHHLASLWKPVSSFEDPPNKKHKAKHRCSWKVAPLILALSRLLLCRMALRKRLLEAWPALKPPQVSARGSLIVSSANISLQRTRGFLQLYFLKNLCSECFSFFLNLLSLSHFSVPLSHCCYTMLLSLPLFSCTFMQNLSICPLYVSGSTAQHS